MSKHVNIPRSKADMEKRYERHEWLPAINVKIYDAPEYTPEKIAAEFGCDAATAERAAEWCYESAQRQFWEDNALDALNFAMLGGDRASEVKPCGLNDGPYKVWADGRSAGWLVAEGLGTVEDMDGPTFQKWRKFCRLIGQEIDHLLSWEYARDMIEGNDWAPKAGTLDAAAENVRTGDTAKLAKVAREAHAYLNGREWDSDTAGNIAACFERQGFSIAAYEPEEDDGNAP